MPTLTLAQIRASVYPRLDNNTRLYTTVEVDAAINDALRTLNLLTGFYQLRIQVDDPTESGRMFYRVPDSMLVTLGAYIGKDPLLKTQLARLSMTTPDWMAARPSSARPPMTWAPMGLRTLVIYPPPSAGGQIVTLSGIGQTPTLVNSSDVISVKDDIASLLDQLAAQMVTMKMPGPEFFNMLPLYKSFLSDAKRIRRWVSYRNPVFFIQAEAERKS